MARLRHQAEGVNSLLGRNHLQRQGLVVPGLQILQELQQQSAHQGGLGRRHLEQIKGQVAGIGAPLCRLLPAPDLDLAELHKATTCRQGLEAGVHPIALEAVEHHIHAAAAGGLVHLISELQAAGIEHARAALLQQQRLLGPA